VGADPSLAIQKAVVEALLGNTEAGDNVFDQVPTAPLPEGPFPRITLGEGPAAGVFADCYDGTETTLVIDVWSRAVGFPEAKRIAAEVRDLLHDAPLNVEGHTLELIVFENALPIRDPDGITRRVSMTFRLQSQPADPPLAAGLGEAEAEGSTIAAAAGAAAGAGGSGGGGEPAQEAMPPPVTPVIAAAAGSAGGVGGTGG
jgi:hypothetical protein